MIRERERKFPVMVKHCRCQPSCDTEVESGNRGTLAGIWYMKISYPTREWQPSGINLLTDDGPSYFVVPLRYRRLKRGPSS